eukprot:scaffold25024_cov12-Tisochrysis_lutea.AAC.1
MTELANGDLKGCWKHLAPEHGCEIFSNSLPTGNKLGMKSRKDSSFSPRDLSCKLKSASVYVFLFSRGIRMVS